jgi:hypothetical protein
MDKVEFKKSEIFRDLVFRAVRFSLVVVIVDRLFDRFHQQV